MSWRRMLALCVAVGMTNSLAWSVINPLGHGPDEFPHTAMVDYVATAKTYPTTGGGLAGEVGLLWGGLSFSVSGYPTWSEGQERYVVEALRANPQVQKPPSYVTNNPPLYYVLAAVPTALLDLPFVEQMWVMRLVSVLLAGLLVAFCFLFMREVFPRHPWAWTLGALAIALQPLVAFLGGAVSPDNALFPSAAALFYFTARALRRGLTARTAAGMGVAALCGSLAKGTMFGLLPGAAFGALAAVWLHRERRGTARQLMPMGVGAAAFAIPFAAWLWVNSNVLDRSASTTTSGVSARGDTLTEFVFGLASYTWQNFLPRLPFMTDLYRSHFDPLAPHAPPFPAFPQYPLWQTYVEGFVGRFSYFEYSFPPVADAIAGLIYVTIAVLAARALWPVLKRVHERRLELLTYFLMAAGVFMVVTINGYVYRKDRGGTNFEQTRYLLPFIPLYAAAIAAACIGMGRRARVAAGIVVVLATGHALGSLGLTLARYYAA